MELLLTGETISAAEALRYGLVNRITAGDVLQEAEKVAVKIAAMPTPGIQATTHLARLAINEASRRTLPRLMQRVWASKLPPDLRIARVLRRKTQQLRPLNFNG